MKMQNGTTLAAVAIAFGLLTTATAKAERAAGMEDKPLASAVVLMNGTTEMSDDGQQEDHLFDGVEKLAAKAKESSEVNLDKSTLGLAARKGGEKAELAKKLDFVVVRSYEFANEGEYNIADVQAILKKLDGDGWKHVVRTRDGKEMTDICMKQDAEGVAREIVIVSAEPKELSLIHLKGNNLSVSDMHGVGGMASYAMHGSASASASSSTSTSTSSGNASSTTKLQHRPQ